MTFEISDAMNELPLEVLLYIAELDPAVYYTMVRSLPDIGRYFLEHPETSRKLIEKWTVPNNNDYILDITDDINDDRGQRKGDTLVCMILWIVLLAVVTITIVVWTTATIR
jgi:hypothetical protein